MQLNSSKPALLCYSLFGILLLVITQVFDFNGLYGQDSYEYCRYSNCWKLFFTTGQKPSDFIWPIYYPFIGSLFALVFKTHFALQLISIFSFVGNNIENIRRYSNELDKLTKSQFDEIVGLIEKYKIKNKKHYGK